MNVDVRQIGSHIAKLTWVGVRSFVVTSVVTLLAGAVMAALSHYYLREHQWFYGAIAAVVALTESLTTGVLLGAKRAVVMVAAHGFGELRMGRALVRLVFERMLVGIPTEDADGQNTLARRGFKRLPLAQADEVLSSAVRSVMGDAEQGGWLRRTVQRWLLEAVRKYTLARFREEGAQQGGVDLLLVQAELEENIDDAIVEKLRASLQLWTALVILGLPLLVAGQTWIVIMVLRS